jgi:hypothetical protein
MPTTRTERQNLNQLITEISNYGTKYLSKFRLHTAHNLAAAKMCKELCSHDFATLDQERTKLLISIGLILDEVTLSSNSFKNGLMEIIDKYETIGKIVRDAYQVKCDAITHKTSLPLNKVLYTSTVNEIGKRMLSTEMAKFANQPRTQATQNAMQNIDVKLAELHDKPITGKEKEADLFLKLCPQKKINKPYWEAPNAHSFFPAAPEKQVVVLHVGQQSTSENKVSYV